MKNIHFSKTQLKNDGSALLAVLIFAAVIGLIGYALAGGQKVVIDAISIMENRGEFKDLQRYITQMVDCERTLLSANGCAEGAMVAIYKNPTHALITIPLETNYTIVGKYKIKAKCGPSDSEYIIEVSHSRGFKCSSGEVPCWVELLAAPLVCS